MHRAKGKGVKMAETREEAAAELIARQDKILKGEKKPKAPKKKPAKKSAKK